MSSTDIAIFLGRFHPLVVHLPIGFLILGFLMWAFEKWKGTNSFSSAISFSLLLGTLSAVAACVLGYLLSAGGGYEGSLLDTHMWAGIATTLVTGILYAFYTYDIQLQYKKTIILVSFGLMMTGLSVTGHVGGSLTHGSDYLTAYAPFGNKKEAEIPKPKSLEEVLVFDHVVQPILKKKCSSCHRESKQKGQLSFADISSIVKGGESGPVLVSGDAESSEMIKRINLPEDHEDFMPPEGKTPLTDEEKELLTWWIDQGATFDAGLSELDVDENTSTKLTAYLGLGEGHGSIGEKVKPLGEVSEQSIMTLLDKGFVVRELVAGSNIYDVTFPSFKLSDSYGASDVVSDVSLLKDNILWLNLSGLGLKDENLSEIANMSNLTKLRLEKNEITDEGIKALINLPKLEVLNLYGNPVTEESIPYLNQMIKLNKVYGWKTEIKKEDSQTFELVL
ncbi:MAG: hypothetical protein JXR03_00815 [Cyclobacteriaceae bacterium]